VRAGNALRRDPPGASAGAHDQRASSVTRFCYGFRSKCGPLLTGRHDWCSGPERHEPITIRVRAGFCGFWLVGRWRLLVERRFDWHSWHRGRRGNCWHSRLWKGWREHGRREHGRRGHGRRGHGRRRGRLQCGDGRSCGLRVSAAGDGRGRRRRGGGSEREARLHRRSDLLFHSRRVTRSATRFLRTLLPKLCDEWASGVCEHADLRLSVQHGKLSLSDRVSLSGARWLCHDDLRSDLTARALHHCPLFGMESHGSFGGKASPACRSSIEILSGDRTKAMCPSRGGRLMVTPAFISRSHVA